MDLLKMTIYNLEMEAFDRESEPQNATKQPVFLSAQRRYENIRVPINEITKRLCYECGDVLSDLNEYQEHLLAHEVVNISYQLYHREPARPSPRVYESDDEKNTKDKSKQETRRKRSNVEGTSGRAAKVSKLYISNIPSFPDNLVTEHETEFSNDSAPPETMPGYRVVTSFPQTANNALSNEFSPIAPHMSNFICDTAITQTSMARDLMKPDQESQATSDQTLEFTDKNMFVFEGSSNSDELEVESLMVDILDRIDIVTKIE
uniref:C2H2-type domain-containing protein n=1 Tax=Acrobeloides nanus TaxID=290746 RepID=A0A914DXX1_9BILA